MVDYLVNKWYTNTRTLELMDDRPSSLLGYRLALIIATGIVRILRLILSIITSIIGFSCLIIIVGEIVGQLVPYMILGIIYLDAGLRALHLGLHIFKN